MQQRRDACLPRTRRTDQRHRLTRIHLEVDVIQYRLIRQIPKRHIAELNRPIVIHQVLSIRFVLNVYRNVKHLEDAFTGCHRTLEDRIVHRDRANRIKEQLNIQDERQHRTYLKSIRYNKPTSDHDDDCQRRSGKRIHHRNHQQPETRRTILRTQILARLLLEQRQVHMLARHPLHYSHAVDVLRQRARRDRTRLPRIQESTTRYRKPNRTTNRQSGSNSDCQQTKPPIHQQHRSHNTRQQHEIANRYHHRLQKLLQRRNIALQARHHPAHLCPIHETHRHSLQMAVHRRTQVYQDVLRNASNDDRLQVSRNRMQQHRTNENSHHDIKASPGTNAIHR